MLKDGEARVLLVEDNAAHAKLMIRSLQQFESIGSILHLNNGASALDYLFRRGEFTSVTTSPQLVLLDLRLPRYDGLTILQQVKDDRRLKSIPVVVLSSSDTKADMAQAYEYNANSYLIKPIDFVEFSRMLHDVGLYWLSWNKAPVSVLN
jgi:CheY-like chemotaxis protein